MPSGNDNYDIRKKLADIQGVWTQSPDGYWYKKEWGEDHVRSIRAGCLPSHDHPIPNTLDSAAACMPERFKLELEQYETGWTGRAVSWDAKHATERLDMADEKALRFAIALQCWEATP